MNFHFKFFLGNFINVDESTCFGLFNDIFPQLHLFFSFQRFMPEVFFSCFQWWPLFFYIFHTQFLFHRAVLFSNIVCSTMLICLWSLSLLCFISILIWFFLLSITTLPAKWSKFQFLLFFLFICLSSSIVVWTLILIGLIWRMILMNWKSLFLILIKIICLISISCIASILF